MTTTGALSNQQRATQIARLPRMPVPLVPERETPRWSLKNPDKACGKAHFSLEDAISERIVEQKRDVSVEVPQLQFIDKVIDIPVVEQREIHMDRDCSEDYRDSPVAIH